LTLDAALADGKYTWAVEAIDYATNSSGYSSEDWFAVTRRTFGAGTGSPDRRGR